MDQPWLVASGSAASEARYGDHHVGATSIECPLRHRDRNFPTYRPPLFQKIIIDPKLLPLRSVGVADEPTLETMGKAINVRQQ